MPSVSLLVTTIERSFLLPLCAGNLHEWLAKDCAQQNLANIKKNLGNQGLKPGSHITVKLPAVPAVVPGALPGTCPRQIFFIGNACPR